VTNLRQRILRATQQQEWQKVRDLQKLLLRSYANLVLSVRQVTQVNAGRRTPGVDGQVVETAAQRMRLVRQLQAEPPSRTRPVRQVYIPRSDGSGRLRPLGIPTLSLPFEKDAATVGPPGRRAERLIPASLDQHRELSRCEIYCQQVCP